VGEAVRKDTLLADGRALSAGSEREMKQGMDKFSRASDNFALTITTKKN